MTNQPGAHKMQRAGSSLHMGFYYNIHVDVCYTNMYTCVIPMT